jgi:ATP-dependent RNA helicase DeaD
MIEIIKFSDLSLSEDLQSAIADMGFIDASPIQSAAIPFILEGRDVIGQAQTGTGKTAAFGIPAIQMLNADSKKTQALVMCPTRELAIQVSDELKKIAKHRRGIKTLPIYGGESIEKQISALRLGVQIVIGTPGRIMDHIDRGTLNLDHVEMVILDEADEMLNMGFIEDIETILSNVPEERQTIFFSATMPKPILELTKRFQKNPEIVKVTKKELTVTNIEQFYYEVRHNARPEALARLIDMFSLKLMLVFCNTKKGVDELVEQLQLRNMQAEGLHGDLRQNQRNNVLSKFKNGVINILVATDVAARGIDVDNVDAVFNFDVPLDEENYVHRIGRTGRAGRQGKSFTFVTGRKDVLKLKDIQNYTKAAIQRGEVPTQDQIAEFRKNQFIEKITNTIYIDELQEFLPMADDLLNSGLSQRNILAALLKLQLGTVDKKGNTYKDEDFRISAGGFEGGNRDRDSGRNFRERSERGESRFGNRGGERDSRGDRNSSFGNRRERPERPERSSNGGGENMVKVFINIGRNQNIRPGDIVGAIAGEARIDGKVIGEIDIKDKFSFVYLPKDVVGTVMDAMNDNTIKGNRVNLEVANG